MISPHRWYVERETRRIYAAMAAGAPEDIRTDPEGFFYAWSYPMARELAELGWLTFRLAPARVLVGRIKACEDCRHRRAKLKSHFAAWREFVRLFRRCKDC